MSACLLIHGFGGSPFEMEPFVAPLQDAGFAVRNICLPGHGDDPAPFERTFFGDWLAAAEKAYLDLAAQSDRVFVAGFSMGGTLALDLAARHNVAGLVCISTPVHVLRLLPWPLRTLRLCASSLYARAERLLQSQEEHAAAAAKEKERHAASRAMAPWKGYEKKLRLPQLFSLSRGCAATYRRLPAVTAPLLLLHDRADQLVYAGNAWEIARRVASPQVRMRLTAIREEITSHHMLPTHQETRALVIAEALAFIREVGPQRSSLP